MQPNAWILYNETFFKSFLDNQTCRRKDGKIPTFFFSFPFFSFLFLFLSWQPKPKEEKKERNEKMWENREEKRRERKSKREIGKRVHLSREKDGRGTNLAMRLQKHFDSLFLQN